jgi:hypothetical protein
MGIRPRRLSRSRTSQQGSPLPPNIPRTNRPPAGRSCTRPRSFLPTSQTQIMVASSQGRSIVYPELRKAAPHGQGVNLIFIIGRAWLPECAENVLGTGGRSFSSDMSTRQAIRLQPRRICFRFFRSLSGRASPAAHGESASPKAFFISLHSERRLRSVESLFCSTGRALQSCRYAPGFRGS